jgi:hypothetical protein
MEKDARRTESRIHEHGGLTLCREEAFSIVSVRPPGFQIMSLYRFLLVLLFGVFFLSSARTSAFAGTGTVQGTVFCDSDSSGDLSPSDIRIDGVTATFTANGSPDGTASTPDGTAGHYTKLVSWPGTDAATVQVELTSGIPSGATVFPPGNPVTINLSEAGTSTVDFRLDCPTTTTTLPEDTGFIPPDTTTFKCEAAVAKAAAKLWSAIAKCHAKAASAALDADTFDEEACEAAAIAKFNTKTGSLTGCPPCVQGAMLTAVHDFIETTSDQNNDLFYCAGTVPLP